MAVPMRIMLAMRRSSSATVKVLMRHLHVPHPMPQGTLSACGIHLEGGTLPVQIALPADLSYVNLLLDGVTGLYCDMFNGRRIIFRQLIEIDGLLPDQ